MLRFKCILEGLCCRLSPITIQSFEAIILAEIARKLGLRISIKPSYKVYEKINRIYLVLSYVLELDKDRGACPFLKNNKCLIHNIYKPLICRSFPYAPKQVKYLYNEELKFVTAHVEYGLSTKCPVIKKDKKYLDKLMKYTPTALYQYMPNEYHSAIEAENKRLLILKLLSKLWRRGFINIVPAEKAYKYNAPYVNVYVFLQKHYPNLPYILGINRVLEKIKNTKRNLESLV